jgi:hypothetical protein
VTKTVHPQFKDRPYWKTFHVDETKEVIREMVNKGQRGTRDFLLSEMLEERIHPDGGIEQIDWPEMTIKEMIDTAQGQMALLEKVRIDVALGLADIPLLYGPLYQRIAPAGGFPGGVFQLDEYTLSANCIFLEHFEGAEVQFGTLSKGVPALGKITAYATGFQWTEDMVEFDQTWNIELQNQAFGRAYNALLNHLHLSPIIGGTYAGGNATAANTAGATAQEDVHLTLQDAYTATVVATPRRTGTVLLASEADRFKIETALLTPVNDAQGNPLPNVPINTIIYYDGESLTVGSDTYSYPGVTAGTCFLVFPQRRLKELVHHDLRIDIGPPDISRLVEGQQVARTRRGLYADLTNSAQKITLP